MDWLLKRKLQNLADRSAPDRVFVRALEQTLKTQLGHPVWWVQAWKVAVAGVSIVSLVGSATGVYAYTSDDVLPGSTLYPVRQGIEEVQQVTAITPAQKATVQLKILKRRLHEQELIAVKQKPIPQAKLDAFNANLDAVVNSAASLPTSTQQVIDEKVTSLEKQHESVLQKDEAEAKTPEQKTRIEGLIKKQRDNVQKTINSLQGDRRVRFEQLIQQRLDRLNERRNNADKRLGERDTRSK